MPNKPRPKVIVTRRLPQAVETRMAELFDVELNLTDTPFTQEQLCTAARNCDVLVPTVTDHVDAAVFAAAVFAYRSAGGGSSSSASGTTAGANSRGHCSHRCGARRRAHARWRTPRE